MSELIIQSSSALVLLPRLDVNVRAATLADLPFIDSLQKMHTKMVGWMPMKQLEGKIEKGHVLIAEEPSPLPSPRVLGEGERVGYVIGHDQYFKRDDVGIIYQMNVLPGKQRGLIGASLLKAQFERSAWGCKLYCCWCAQDIAANHFWESMGFVPLAFRAGSRGKDRVHIFWQRRIRSGDVTTPYWFPSQTSSGAIREDRLVLPIPPGVRWSDAMPRVLPALSNVEGPGEENPKLEIRNPKQIQSTKSKGPKPQASQTAPPVRKALGGWSFAPPVPIAPAAPAAPARKPRERVKNDPKLIAAARELRDRWLEEVNAGRYLPDVQGKYDVSRALDAAPANPSTLPMLGETVAA